MYKRQVLYGTFMADYTDSDDGFCVTVHQAQQNYPKAIKSCADGVAVMLVPEGVGQITMQSGMAKEQNFLIPVSYTHLDVYKRQRMYIWR